MLEQNDRGLGSELATFKRIARHRRQSAPPGATCSRRFSGIEAQVGPPGTGPAGGQRAVPRLAQPTSRLRRRGRLPDDAQRAPFSRIPSAVYTTEVKDALVDVMVDYGGGLPVAPNEWLTVRGARPGRVAAAAGRSLRGSTILVRIKGADLAAFRAGQIDREQTRGRVELREY